MPDLMARAAEFIEQLPTGSRISVLPLCGSPTGTSLDAYRVKEDALEAVAAVPVDLPPLNEATSGATIPGGRNQRKGKRCHEESRSRRSKSFRSSEKSRSSWVGERPSPKRRRRSA